MADVPKHHREQEREGDDREDLQPGKIVSAVGGSNEALRAAQTASASCSGAGRSSDPGGLLEDCSLMCMCFRQTSETGTDTPSDLSVHLTSV